MGELLLTPDLLEWLIADKKVKEERCFHSFQSRSVVKCGLIEYKQLSCISIYEFKDPLLLFITQLGRFSSSTNIKRVMIVILLKIK